MALLAAAYLAGVLTIASPCILPILPFVFSRAGKPFASGSLPMLAGMIATFAAVATLAAVGGGWAVQANEVGRTAAFALLALFALTLISPRLATAVAGPVVVLGGWMSARARPNRATARGSFVLGIATGLLWAPCAGPILGLILTGAAFEGANARTTFLLVAYATGAATSLALAVLAGGKLIAPTRDTLGLGPRLRQATGVAVLAGVTIIALGLDTMLLAPLSYAGTARVEQSLLDGFGADPRPAPGEVRVTAANDGREPYRSHLPVEGTLPSLDGAVAWLNSAPLSATQLRGKVVLVDFWTYSCINCIRTLPYLRAWAEKYKSQNLVVVGIHSPEFAFEKRLENVKDAVRSFGLDYPIAIDSDFKIWRSFRNSYWPALYFVDAEGRVRHHVYGEGEYQRSEKVIQDLLAEAVGSRASDQALVTPDGRGAQAPPGIGRVQSSETYVGYEKGSNFASPEGIKADAPRIYSIAEPRLNQWGLVGNWTVGAEKASLGEPGGGIVYRFGARDLNVILGPGASGKPVGFRVTVDGKAPGADHGADTDADGNGSVSSTRLYQLVRQLDGTRERTFEIRFLGPDAEAYAFTFG